MANEKNLKSWKPGQSGNLKGKPRGSRNVKTVIRELLSSHDTYYLLPENVPRSSTVPLEAIICTLLGKALAGDIKAADVLLKYAVDRDEPSNEGGFFSSDTLVIKVVSPAGQQYGDQLLEIDEATGQLRI